MPKQQTDGNSNIVVNGAGNNISVANNTTYNTYHGTEKVKFQNRVVGEYDKDVHITQAQQSKLQDIIKEVVELEMLANPKAKIGDFMKYHWTGLNRHCKVSSYKLIAQTDFEKAVKYLQKQRTIKRKDIKYKNAAKFKELTIPAIWARWSQLGREKDSLYEFACTKLNKKVTTLEKLSVDDIDTVYKKVFALKQ